MKPHFFVATPMYGGQCTGFYTQSLLLMQRMGAEKGIDFTFSFMFNESLITRARNSLAKGFLKSDCTHLFFIDADIRFYPEHIPAMLEADRDIICGIYPKKEINWPTVRRGINEGVADEQLARYTGSFVVNLKGYQGEVVVPVSEPVEIWNGGTGFMLIKREVFERLQPLVPKYTNNVVDLGKSVNPDEMIDEFFATSIEPETNVLLSEDYHFCRLARENGMGVWAAPWAQLGHMGNYLFEGQLLPSP